MDDFLQEARRESPVFVCRKTKQGGKTPCPGSGQFRAGARQAEGERPEPWMMQRWEAVFRRERRPASLDRNPKDRFAFLRAGRGLPGPLSAAAPLERSFPL